jgi:L-lactate permease
MKKCEPISFTCFFFPSFSFSYFFAPPSFVLLQSVWSLHQMLSSSAAAAYMITLFLGHTKSSSTIAPNGTRIRSHVAGLWYRLVRSFAIRRMSAGTGSGSDYVNDGYTLNCQQDYIDATVAAAADSCASSCVGIQACLDCLCRLVAGGSDAGGPWGDAGDVCLGLLPVAWLVAVTVKRTDPWPTPLSLPCAAAMLAFLRLAYFGSDPILVGGAVLSGLLEALTPLSIMTGAIALFECMEATLCLPYMLREMTMLSHGHAIAELLLLFAFGTMVEGASGFGTPVALSAPILVRSGHDAQRAVSLCPCGSDWPRSATAPSRTT